MENHDLCPMCNGKGTHDLKAPYGVYVVVRLARKIQQIRGADGETLGVMTSVFEETHDEWNTRVNTVINKYANEGYEMPGQLYMDDYNATFVMQWRWR